MRFKTLQMAVDLTKKYSRHVLLMGMSSLGVTLMDGLTVFSLAPISDAIMNSTISDDFKLTRVFVGCLESLNIAPTASNLLFVVLLINVVRAGAHICSHFVIQKLKYMVVRDVLKDYLGSLLNAKWEFFTDRNTGKILNVAQREVGRIGEATRIIGTVFANSIQLIVLLCIPFYLSWKVTLIIFSSGIVCVLLISLLNRQAYTLGKANVDAAGNYTSSLHQTVAGMKLIQLYGKRVSSLKEVLTRYWLFADLDIKISLLHISVSSLYIPLGFLMVFITFITGTKLGLPIGLVVMLLYSIHQLIPSAKQIASLKTQASTIVPSYFFVQDELAQALSSVEHNGSTIFDGFKDKIEFKSVKFQYRSAKSATLSDIDMTVNRGQMVALVGPSGSGKSTISDILAALYVPEQGAVLVDGTSLFDYDLQSYRDKIACVTQNSHLFDTSIRENLLWSKPDATQADIEEACRLANAVEFITDLPDGLDTIVGERGVRLSGGQAQRISLARAIIRKPELLILDEATSALDSESEYKIQESISSIAKTTTIFVIAHRLSTIKTADCIYVIKDGHIIEKGSYDQLVEMDEAFNKMLKQQFEASR